ncbi:Protein CBG10819 [Caenorhabditis briggsae]|uniref:Tyrosine-protein kinase n=2 Tax=Caenorhabditis briggsae TaxID=6238 RepID=A8XBV6_CAEBR|nr:Protein CBG10819 [Caenorhabditis briggsae]ULU11290.1 hypothetical protein L3Y34_015039 [Caenorhabditis briggsae]CAP30122.2 Protein CBG10819 [Caenorhabditis briggsae]
MANKEKLPEEDINLPYYHGALMNQDADQLLVNDGDYMIVMKMNPEINKMQLFLAVCLKKGIRRFEIKRTPTTAKFANKSAPNIGKLVDSLKSDIVDVKGERVILKRAIPKGKFQLMHKDVDFKKKLGSGAYGTVYRGRLTKSNQKIAVKKLDTEGNDEEMLAEMMKEARVMQLYDHPNIVKFYGYILDDIPYLLVLEYCNGGSVEDRLVERGAKLTTQTRITYTYHAACGIDYLHKKKCIHRDIAARNCLIHKEIVKIADFGMCRNTSVYKVDLNKPTNIRWLAPEVWEIGETRANTDIYAFAVMMWEFFEIPYDTPYSAWKGYVVKQKTRGGYRLPTPKGMPPEMEKIMQECWHVDPSQRPTATELKEKLEEAIAKGESSATTGLEKSKSQTSTKQQN